MQKKGENRIKEYLSKRNRYKRWVSVVIVLALLVGITTIYSLNKDASATTKDGADEVGMVIDSQQENASESQNELLNSETFQDSSNDASLWDDVDYGDEVDDNASDGQNTDGNNEDAESDESDLAASDSIEASSASSDASLSSNDSKEESSIEYVAVDINLSIVDEDGDVLNSKYSDIDLKSLSFDSEGILSVGSELYGNITVSNSEGNSVYYSYSDNSFDGYSIKAIKRISVDESNSASALSSAGVASAISEDTLYNYYYTKDNSEWIQITQDSNLALIYKKDGVAASVKMSVVDEFGDEIDSSYTDMDLTGFNDNILSLDDVDNAPVAKVRKVLKTYKTYKKYSSEYEYVQALIDGTVIKNIKRTALDADNDVYSYSYTTDGSSYTDITSDTTIILEYASGESDTYKFTYSDDNVSVTATLQVADAIPEDAELLVTQITKGDAFDAYISALDDAQTDDDITKVVHTSDNTLLYDVAFIVSEEDSDGTVTNVEYEPTEGSVKVVFEFKNNQLSELGVTSSDNLNLSHMVLDDETRQTSSTTLEASNLATSDDISIENISTSTVEISADTKDAEKIEFVTDSFSVYAITLTNNAIVRADLQRVTDYSYEKSLADAYGYGVVTNTYSWSGDTESNVMAGYVKTTGVDLGTSVNYSNAGGNNYFGDFNTSITEVRFHKEPANIYLGSGAYNKYKNKKLTFDNADNTNISSSSINVSSIIDSIDEYYATYEGFGSSFEAAYRDNGGTTIDLRGYADGTYVLTYTGDNIYIDDEKLIIYINEGQHLILNCTASRLKIGTYYLNGNTSSSYVNNSSSDNDWLTTAVIFNVVNAKTVTISNTCGVFIAPDSDVSTGANNAGVVVCNSIDSGSEWHYHNHDLASPSDAEVVLKATKTVNSKTPSDNEVFTFKVYEWNSSTKKWGTDAIATATNIGSDITFEAIRYSSDSDAGTHYYKIVEEAGDGNYTYDSTIYVAKVVVKASTNSSTNTTKYSATDPVYYTLKDASKGPNQKNNLTKISTNVPSFNNESKDNESTGMLRIHKMVVNDFGSDFVRDNTSGNALLSNIVFRITNNDTKNYIIFTTFTGRAGDTGTAYEYDGSTLKMTGNTYTVTYNQSAQWTVSDIPAGTYTVEEVADGLTLSYDSSTNTSSVIESTNLSRVTKYDVTVDDEDTSTRYGTGGQNLRKVFSADLDSHNDKAPTNVKVGDTSIANTSHTETVQVCNYYSIPIGPIQITKNFSGGEWSDDLAFTFKIEGTGYTAYDSSGNEVTLSSQPLPETSTKSNGSYTTTVADTVTLTSSDATKNEDGTYTAVASFESIPFRFEGIYYYKITEVAGNADGITYDSSVYYVKVVVSKKYTTFYKTYTWDHMTHPAKYTADTTLEEDFYYLGADVTYSDDEKFSNVLAQCELYLGTNPDTTQRYNNTFIVNYTKGSIANVAFNNYLSGNLTVSKTWLDSSGNDDSANHTVLTLYLLQRVTGTKTWTLYSSNPYITLSNDTGWTATITGLPIMDSKGNYYEYTVKESDTYSDTYLVTYTYKGTDYITTDSSGDMTIDEASSTIISCSQSTSMKDTGYVMTVGDDGKSYGSVTITNKSVVVNVLPSTGGIGTTIFYIIGILLILAAATYFILKRVRNSKNE